MSVPKLSKFETQVLEVLWEHGPASVREVMNSLKDDKQHAYTTIQTVLMRLEEKGAVSRTGKIGNAHIFAADLTQEAMQKSALDNLLRLFGGRAQPVVSHLIESGHLTQKDIETARNTVRELARNKKIPGRAND